MPNFDGPKKATNLSLDAATIEKAKALGLNLSKVVNELLEKEVRRVYRLKWAERNKTAIEAYNAQVDSEGTFAQQVNDWLVEQNDTDLPAGRKAA